MSRLLESITDYHNNVVTYQYNSRGQMNRVLLPNGGIVSKTYNDFGQVLTNYDEKTGETATYQYSDQLVSTDPQYHIPPRLVKVTNHLGKETQFEYNAWGQITKTIDPNNVETLNGYDSRGNLVTSVNGEGDIVKYRYDIFDRLVKYLDGNYSTLPEANQKYTEYFRDVFGRIVAEKDPAGKITTYEFTGDNCSSCNSGSNPNLVSHISRPETKSIDMEHVFVNYDLMGRTTHVLYNGTGVAPSDWTGAQLVFTYNDSGQVEAVLDNRLLLAGDKTYHFDHETETGMLLKITQPEGYTQEYIYDDQTGDLKAYRDVDGNVIEYGFENDYLNGNRIFMTMLLFRDFVLEWSPF